MTTSRDQKREQFRESLIAAAESRIARDGLSALRARDIASDVGCALGGIYTAFARLDDLILQVNRRTLARMGAALSAAAAGQPPRDALRALARAYAGFARENRALWEALFAFRLAAGTPPPDWLKDEQMALLKQVIAPLSELRPGLSDDALEVRARTYFNAVHGVVTMSLQGWFLGLAEDRLIGELDSLVGYLAEGSAQGGPVPPR